MKGDFSRVHYAPNDNFNGVLPQQGKVLLDSDGIAQALIEDDWHQTAARDWVGPVAGVPAATPDSFNLSAATLSAGVATVTVGTGHLWADGLLVRLEDKPGTTVDRTATWIEPPIVPNEGNATDVTAGTTDVLLLEVWQRAVNGFEIPNTLIEPALGGPDTAERLQSCFAFRLARLAEGQTCADLTYNESGRGSLTASLVPAITTAGDCPVEGSGGYSGFEHQLYRIEIADTNGPAAQFKWSRSNGGLVGRGNFSFDAVSGTNILAITANLPAITSANQTRFYVEIEAYDALLGYSRVIVGARATLNQTTFTFDAAINFGAFPAASGPVFFRLWDDLANTADFPAPKPLENGILLQFSPALSTYFPGDYWMFPVRAGGISNPQILIDAKPPQGIVYHRVPLAEITWANGVNGGFAQDTIEDCRTIIPPLSRIKGCCTCTVGDGIHSFGNFKSINDAIQSLPAEGGEVCLLPGLFHEYVVIQGCKNVVIHGCGWQTRVASPPPATINIVGTAPQNTMGDANSLSAVFTIEDSAHIELRSFAIEAADGDAGILIDGAAAGTPALQTVEYARAFLEAVFDVTLKELVLTASTLPAILARSVHILRIEQNRVAMTNVASQWPAISVAGTEVHIERNWVGVEDSRIAFEHLPTTVLADISNFSQVFGTTKDVHNGGTILHPGGIQIGGPSTDVYILENEIEGGSRNGISLGSLQILDAKGDDTGTWVGTVVTADDDDCCTGTLGTPVTDPSTPGSTVVAGGPLTNIHIHRNRIRNMGLCGIGPVGFFDLMEALEVITITGLAISANSITQTLLRNLAAVRQSADALYLGYGAISLPDASYVTLRDNTITDFGITPGAPVCGIFVLHTQAIEISRNHIIESRDFAEPDIQKPTPGLGVQGGIYILLATPPPFAPAAPGSTPQQSGTYTSPRRPVYQSCLPAVRVEHNVVRIPLGDALAVLGIGPFTIINNHFGSGGMIVRDSTPLAETILILNLGTTIENLQASQLPTAVFSNSAANSALGTINSLNPVSSGTVLFANNVCQLEARFSGEKALTSVFIYTPDHLIFSANHCWLDATKVSVVLDAALIAGTLNVVGNRFQESSESVLFSGLTAGRVNITEQNISTSCLITLAPPASLSANANLVINPALSGKDCIPRWDRFLAGSPL